jgi:hypothetical protein
LVLVEMDKQLAPQMGLTEVTVPSILYLQELVEKEESILITTQQVVHLVQGTLEVVVGLLTQKVVEVEVVIVRMVQVVQISVEMVEMVQLVQ